MISREPTIERLAIAQALMLEPFGLTEAVLQQVVGLGEFVEEEGEGSGAVLGEEGGVQLDEAEGRRPGHQKPQVQGGSDQFLGGGLRLDEDVVRDESVLESAEEEQGPEQLFVHVDALRLSLVLSDHLFAAHVDLHGQRRGTEA